MRAFVEREDNGHFQVHGRLIVRYNEIEKKTLKKERVLEDWEKERQEMEARKNIGRKKRMEEEDNVAQAHLVVAAIIKTVTFAAGIIMPRGFVGRDNHPHPGSAVLRKSAAFKAFIITNALLLIDAI